MKTPVTFGALSSKTGDVRSRVRNRRWLLTPSRVWRLSHFRQHDGAPANSGVNAGAPHVYVGALVAFGRIGSQWRRRKSGGSKPLNSPGARIADAVVAVLLNCLGIRTAQSHCDHMDGGLLKSL